MTRAFAKLRVGYVPYTPDLSGPGDRRRFCRYAAVRDMRFEVARPGAAYDLLVLASLADVTSWSRAPRTSTKIVYDLPDSYLDIGRLEPKALLRGPMKFALRQHRYLEWSYHDSLARMCARADAVVCSTPEQRERILPFSENVHAILDYHGAAARSVKTDFTMGDTANFVWEGIATNLSTFAPIADVLRSVGRKRALALHAITDLEYKPVNGPVPLKSTRRLVERVLPGVETYLYQWNELLFSTICTRCDLALIPMTSQPLFRAKAENKLLLLWRMAMPTIVADTPAYVRTMRDAGVSMACGDVSQWQETIERYIGDESARRAAAEAGRRYAETRQGEDAISARWDRMMESVLT